MEIKSFIKFLTEMPLPIGHDPKSFDPKPGKYSSASIIRKFNEIGFQIGKGSSRVAFKIDVQASQFDPKVLKEYGLQSFAGMVTTVFKLALNPKGIAQNKAEIDNFNTALDYGHEQYLLPILDTSLRNKKYTYADEELSNWIQMPLAPPPSTGTFKKMFDGMYGKGMLEKFKYARSPSQMRNVINNGGVIATEEQQEAFDDFLTALEDLQIGIGDLGRPANWGVWNNKLYIIDFGYDTSTENLYRGTELATAFVDKNGDITLNIRKQAPRNRW